MTKAQKRGTAAVIGVFAASALLAWLGGYDFDARSPGVASWGACTLLLAIQFWIITVYEGIA